METSLPWAGVWGLWGGGVSSPPPTVKFCLDMVLATRVSKGVAPKFSSATPTPILCRGRAPPPPSSVHPPTHYAEVGTPQDSPLQHTSSPTHYAEVGTPQDSPLQHTSSPTHCAEVGTPQDFPLPAYISLLSTNCPDLYMDSIG